ncbi:hypothetical protein [Herbidospora yilanensis]|uniref:hypothetical protein n=1 Tax=Herbidospora yilanensis TaxID=354426 RepID=UPI000785FA78|nr:hypothetical protein [Herbidospora yilanensis]
MSHTHVDRKILEAGAAYRNLLVSSTGWGVQAPHALTSIRPESLTCLPGREHAAAGHRRYAGQVERLSRMTGSVVTPAEAGEAATRARDTARKFAN